MKYVYVGLEMYLDDDEILKERQCAAKNIKVAEKKIEEWVKEREEEGCTVACDLLNLWAETDYEHSFKFVKLPIES